MSVAALVTHIRTLIAADTTLSSLKLGLVNYGIPKVLPAIYIDAIIDTDDKQSSMTFNICFVTNDMTIEQFDNAQKVKTAIQQSHCIKAQGLLPRPEVDRNRWIIPCEFYPNKL